MIFSLVLNLLNFAVTTYIMLWWFFLTEQTKSTGEKIHTFRYFTTDSNILCAVASLVMAIAEIVVLAGGAESVPLWIVLFKFIGTSAVMLTFLTVLCFLGPTCGYKAMYARDGFHMHMAGPLFALISFVFLEAGTQVAWPFFLLGMIPEALYAGVYMNKVVVIGEEKGGWPDFYFFNKNGKWYISFVLMLLAGLAISALLILGYRLMSGAVG